MVGNSWPVSAEISRPSLRRPRRLDVHVERGLAEHTELAAHLSVAEALTSAAKHARATVVDVELSTDGDELSIAVPDDGRGGANLAAGSGRIGLSDRMAALGGRLTVHSPPGAGTALAMTLPLDRPQSVGPGSVGLADRDE